MESSLQNLTKCLILSKNAFPKTIDESNIEPYDSTSYLGSTPEQGTYGRNTTKNESIIDPGLAHLVFWQEVMNCDYPDPTQNSELLVGYLEAYDRVGEWVFVAEEKGMMDNVMEVRSSLTDEEFIDTNKTDLIQDEDTLFYEISMDERTKVICDVYGMMSNLMLQLETLVTKHSPNVASSFSLSLQPTETSRTPPIRPEFLFLYQLALLRMSQYLESPWSQLLQQRRRILLYRLCNIVSLLQPETLPTFLLSRLETYLDRNNRSEQQSVAMVRSWLNQVHAIRQNPVAQSELLTEARLKNQVVSTSLLSQPDAIKSFSLETNSVEPQVHTIPQPQFNILQSPPSEVIEEAKKDKMHRDTCSLKEEHTSADLVSHAIDCTTSERATGQVLERFQDENNIKGINSPYQSTASSCTLDIARSSFAQSLPLIGDRIAIKHNRKEKDNAIEKRPVDLTALAAIEEDLFKNDENENEDMCSDSKTEISHMDERQPSGILRSSSIQDYSAVCKKFQKLKSVTFHPDTTLTSLNKPPENYVRKRKRPLRHQTSKSTHRNKVTTNDEENKEEQETLTAFIGEAVGRLRDLAYQSRAIITKDRKRLETTTMIQDNYLHETKFAYFVASHLTWIGSFSFIQEMFMLAIASGLFLFILSLIASTVVIA